MGVIRFFRAPFEWGWSRGGVAVVAEQGRGRTYMAGAGVHFIYAFALSFYNFYVYLYSYFYNTGAFIISLLLVSLSCSDADVDHLAQQKVRDNVRTLLELVDPLVFLGAGLFGWLYGDHSHVELSSDMVADFGTHVY